MQGDHVARIIDLRLFGGPGPRRSVRFAPAAVLFAVILAVGSRSAHAASPDEAQRKNTARGLADYANQLVAAGNYEGAITAFKQADQIYHAPTLVLALARANAKARHLLAARDLYRQIIAEQLAADAPDEFRNAQRVSKEEVAVVTTSIPTLEVRVHGTGAGPAIQVTVDEKPLNQGEATDVDPGKHVIKATGAGDPRTRGVVLADKAHQIVDIDLDATATEGPSIVPGAIVAGVGGLGLIVGTIAGAITLHNASAIRANCASNVCPPSDMSKVSSTNAVADVSTVGFVIAGVGAVVGTVLIVRSVTGKPSVSASIGPGSLFLRGTF